ncbi:MAG: hypothetical protein ACP5I8_00655, partial [Phycisphaerae bacterium]
AKINAPINLLNLSTLPRELEHLGHLAIRKANLSAFWIPGSGSSAYHLGEVCHRCRFLMGVPKITPSQPGDYLDRLLS